MLNVQPGPRDRRLLSALLILGVVAVAFFIVSQLTDLFFYFGDIILTFFLAWLFAFILSPIVSRSSASSRACRAPSRPSWSTARSSHPACLLVVVAAGALATSIADFTAQLPEHQGEPAGDPGAVAGAARLGSASARSTSSPRREAALANLDDIAAAARRAAPADRGRQPGRGRDRCSSSSSCRSTWSSTATRCWRSCSGSSRRRIARRRASSRPSVSRSFGGFIRGQAIEGFVYFLDRARHEPRCSACASCPHLGRRRAPPDDPVLRAVRLVGPAGVVAIVLKPDAVAPDDHPHGRRLVRRHERRPAARHAGRVGIHPIVVLGSVLIGVRIAGIPGRHLRDPGRGRHLRLLLPLPANATSGGPVGHRTGGAPPRGSARASRSACPREPAPGERDRHRRPDPRPRPSADPAPASRAWPDDERREHRTAAGGHAGHDPRARPAERRDLDKERGEPVAGGSARGGPRRAANAAPAARPPRRRPGRGSSSPTTTASSRAACSRSSRRSSRSARSRSSRPRRTRAPSATRRRSCARCASGSGSSATARWPGRSTAPRPTRSASPSSATSATASTSSPRASTTAPTSATTSPTRARSARRWRRSSTTARRSRSRRSTTPHPDFTLAAPGRGGRRPQHPRARPRGRRARQRQRAGGHRRGVRRRRGDAHGQARLPGRAHRAARPARHPVLLDRRPAAVRARRSGHRLPRRRQPADRRHARSSST